MEIKLAPGDKVRLVSGGPEMTVRGNHYDVIANVYSTNMFDCIWYAKNKDGKEEVQYCPFQEAELIKTRSA